MGHYINADKLNELIKQCYPYDNKQPYGGRPTDIIRIDSIIDDLQTTPKWNEDFLLHFLAKKLLACLPMFDWNDMLKDWMDEFVKQNGGANNER